MLTQEDDVEIHALRARGWKVAAVQKQRTSAYDAAYLCARRAAHARAADPRRSAGAQCGKAPAVQLSD